jgi:hypothetical protein
VSLNSHLLKAKTAKNDEFYTLYEDIEREMVYYHKHLKGKSVYLPCDNPRFSMFWKYFVDNFEVIGLKQVMATYLSTDSAEIWVKTAAGTTIRPLKSNGDFRSEECKGYLKSCDVVITNPPFSLFRELLDLILASEKDYILMGTLNVITYKIAFPLLQQGKMWLGVNKRIKNFKQPDGTLKSFGNIVWFTSMDHGITLPEIPLTKKYDPDKYPKYDHYDAINVDRVADIPKDYYSEMGVPITFMLKYNPEQFEIIDALNQYSTLHGPTPETRGRYLTAINGKIKYVRVVIKRKVV